jgi:hypothetical protein
MLSSEDALSPMARTLQSDVPKVIPVNGPVEALRLSVRQTLKSDPVASELMDVECGLSVTAKSPERGRVTLRCEPEIQHGERQHFLRPTAEGTGFSRQEQKPRLSYPALGFEVTLAPGEYLVVGPTAEPLGTLGQAYFYAAAGDHVRQRVLVVRAGMVGDALGDVNAPLRPTTAAAAAQAAMRPTARGVAQ